MRAANPTWNGKSTQVWKSFVFFAGLELHGIKIDRSTMNVHKGINRYSAEEKEKARKELWRMQVKFEGELCEPIDHDIKKRHRTLGSQTSNKRRLESENTESGERAEHTEAAANGPDGPDQVPMDQGRTHMPSGDAPADPHRWSNRGHGHGGMDSPCPPRPPTQVEEVASHVKGFVDQMLHDFKIANQERDGLQKRLEEAKKRLKDMKALHAKIGMLKKEKKEMAKRVQFIGRPDLYELLTKKLRGHQIHGAEVINRDTGKLDTGDAGLHPDEFQGSDNEVDIAARDENKVLLVTEVSRALSTWRDQVPGMCLVQPQVMNIRQVEKAARIILMSSARLPFLRLRREFALLESQVRGP
ncbi:hypothetical protein R1flu_015644 [Riccia fluitans]|uniref:Uncharacterized protein n=1 Tax=Riccia fluitans TaxID=41844 RepID=A0ABD1YJQ7_9MARC